MPARDVTRCQAGAGPGVAWCGRARGGSRSALVARHGVSGPRRCRAAPEEAGEIQSDVSQSGCGK